MKTQQEAVLTIKEADELIAIGYHTGGGDIKLYMVQRANMEDYQKLLEK